MGSHHDIIVAGWDSLNGGWVIECTCGFFTDASPLMTITGDEFDDHLRSVGVLKEE